MADKRYPLEGIKVVDLSTVVAAPTAAELLCAFGAEVIKVEAVTGDGQRYLGQHFPLPSTDDCNPLYTLQNANKKQIAINLKSEDGKKLIHALLADADIFLTNVRPKGLERLGLDYETLSKELPKIIYAHFGGYGPEGPNKDDPGYDSTVFWLRGGMSADWSVENVEYPFSPTYAFGDTVTASSFFSAILMAIIGREKFGIGTKVETSLYSSAIWCNGQGVVMTQFGKKRLNPDPKKTTNPLIGYYLCGDGRWVNINQVMGYEKDVIRISEVLGVLDEVEKEADFLSFKALGESGKAYDLRQIYEKAFLTKPAAEWKKLFQVINMPFDVAVPTNEIPSDPQARINGYVEDVVYPDGTTVAMPVPPMFLSNFDRRETVPTGKISEHADEILEGHGFSAEEIEALRASGVIL